MPRVKKRGRAEGAAGEAAPGAAKEMQPVTKPGERPQKKFYRSRAHCNPLSHNDTFEYPVTPDEFDWSTIYPELNRAPDFVDVGCGFGGLTVALAEKFPDALTLGLEIRPKVPAPPPP